MEIAVLSLLAAIPTALGYVLGPLTRTIGRVTLLVGLPISPRLGLLPLATVTVLARAYLGKGGGVKEGILLAATGAFFHPRDLGLRLPRNILLGVGIELALLKVEKPGAPECILASLMGGIFSYTPYLLFAPPEMFSATVFLASIIVSTVNYLLAIVIGGYFAALVLKRVKALPGLR